MKKYIKYLLSFIIPIGIFCIALAINDIAPFGHYIINAYDSKVQYPGFFMALKNFHFYLFNVGFGINFLGTVTYYLMSPLNLLIHFFSIYQYNTFYFLLIILKIGLCGLTMQYFLSHEDKHDNLWSTIFSVIYALIGFISTYYYNVFWLDSIILLPLILVGINKIIKNKSPLFYIISLSLTIIISFYTGYMCCIFSVIYFIYKLVETNNYKNKKIIFRFIISSLLSASIACIVLLPSFYALMNGKASGFADDYTKYIGFNNNIKYFFYSLTPGNYHSREVSNGFAQIYCSLFIVCLFITSFFNKKIDIKTKSITIIILLFYILSFSFNLVDYSWQFFQKPVWWQHRYSFTLSLFIIIIAYKNLMNFSKLNLSTIKKGIIYLSLACLIIISFILFFNKLNDKSIFRIFIIAFSILLLVNYLFVFNLNNKTKYLIIPLIILELGLNCYINVKENNKHNMNSFEVKTHQSNINYLSQIDDNTFYRLEATTKDNYNKGLLYNFNGLNYFNSVRNQSVVDIMENYFDLYVDSHCSITLYKYDPYILSLFNIKYLIGEEEVPYLEKINENVYRNNYPLSLGFMVNKDLLNIDLEKDKYHDNMSKIYSKMLNKDLNLYYKLKGANITYDNAYYDQENNVYRKINDKEEGKVYLEFTAKEDMIIIVDDNEIGNKTYINNKEVKRNYLYKNEFYPFVKKGDVVKIEVPLLSAKQKRKITDVHYIKEDEYVSIMEELGKNTLENIVVNDKHTLQGTVNAKESGLLFTSMAYEKGMIIKVNGKKIKPELIFNAFIGIHLNKGKNVITIDYIPQGLILGSIISLTGIILTVIYLKKLKYN